MLCLRSHKTVLRLSNRSRIIVGARLATTEDDEAVLVTVGADNCNNARLTDRKEVVRVLSTVDRVSTV